MSAKVRPRQFKDPQGCIVEDFSGNVLLATNAGVPAGVAGFAIGCLMVDVTNATLYQNTGTALVAIWTQMSPAATPASTIVAVTASTLTITQALHHNKTMVLDRAAGIAITLPAAAAGLHFRFIIKTTFTGAASIKSVAGADIMIGHATMGNDSDNTTVDWPAVAASTYDTIDMLGTSNSTGGMAGQEIEILGLATNLWFVRIQGDAAGTEATPFQDTVA